MMGANFEGTALAPPPPVLIIAIPAGEILNIFLAGHISSCRKRLMWENNNEPPIPFGNDLYHLFVVTWGMVYYCYYHFSMAISGT